LDYIKTHGIAEDSDYQYTSGGNNQPGLCMESYYRRHKVVVAYHKECSFGPCGRIKLTKDMFPCQKINHAVVLVAWLAEENAYKLMNSWRRDWGENGFFRVEQRDLDDTCFIEREAFLLVVKVEPKPNPSPKPKPKPKPKPNHFIPYLFLIQMTVQFSSVCEWNGTR
jgi:hypothetical protein